MSPLSLNSKLRSWLGSSRFSVPLLVAVSSCGLAAPRPRRLRALAFGPALLGLTALGVLGWRAAQARIRPSRKVPAPGRDTKAPFNFTWQMSEEITASAASGH
ncbi:hypothetical protein HPC49_00800 [Pyxidicoccus fallax]|uniref:Uncharacterized protein n=1 Tax=Pyxidicoccus fallax TaxID=394095 RepID=A0A848LG76_9BACT|nr:hypothetical protein [Pyxidicoccus fallax]NMO14818.1 hypothetical protein [Pyxidicoccus fallax]NPC76791.1 hypothetical protein [Pyxidicoccus fallax]